MLRFLLDVKIILNKFNKLFKKKLSNLQIMVAAETARYLITFLRVSLAKNCQPIFPSFLSPSIRSIYDQSV